MVEPGTVRRLLEVIEQRLAVLRSLSDTPIAEYRSDPALQAQTERHLEVMIQACIDLGLHILADRPVAMPETNRGVFVALGGLGLLDEDLVDRLVGMAGFRNVLAHGYAEIDPTRVHDHLSHLEDAKAMVEALAPYLREHGAL